jgi:hypothetical protein
MIIFIKIKDDPVFIKKMCLYLCVFKIIKNEQIQLSALPADVVLRIQVDYIETCNN